MRRLVHYLLLILFCQSAMAADSRYEPRPNLTVLADESLMLPLAELTRDYATRTRTPVTVVIKNPEEAERQIEQGLEAHLVLTANGAMLNRITEQGLTDVSSRRLVARARMALVTSQEVRKTLNVAERISFAAMLKATTNLPIYALENDTPEGARAHALTVGQDFSERLAPRLSTKDTPEDIFNTLRDEPSLALMLATSSVGEPDIVVLSVLPEGVSPSVGYEVVVLGSELMDAAKSFAAYLTSKEAQAIFAHYGYQT